MKFAGNIGFSNQVEKSPGVWAENPTIKRYAGEIRKIYNKPTDDASINTTLTTHNSISIITDSYLSDNLSKIIYVEWSGVKWEVKSIDVSGVRTNLVLGGEYHE